MSAQMLMPQRTPPKRHDTGFSASVEIAFLVENFVIGKANLAVNRNFPAIFNDRSRVVATAFMLFRMADDQGDALDPACQFIQRPLAGAVKIRAQQAGLPADSHTTPVPASAVLERRALLPARRIPKCVRRCRSDHRRVALNWATAIRNIA
jgi:hypothetical protein